MGTRSTFLIFVLGVIASVLNNVSAQGPYPVVTSEGTVVGTQLSSGRIIGFLGVPYAKAPIGELRFKLPERPDRYSTLQASSSRICPQLDPYNQGFNDFNEDCLTLDIYTKQVPTPPVNVQSLRNSVLVYLPGVKFRYGGSSTFKPENILDSPANKEAVLVVVNYRLGLLGFMSTEDHIVPGNMGLFDQRMALEWISKNIDKFGGNPNKILLFGHDSGAVSVGLHLVSKKSAGLFQRAAMLGGAIENPWAFRYHQARRYAETFARRLNCDTRSSQRMLECLREKPISEIVTLQNTYTNISFLPVVDKNFTNTNDPFLEATPMELIQKKQVNSMPMFFGMTSDEGSMDFYERLNDAKKETLPRSAMSVYLKEYLFPKTVFGDGLNLEEDRAMENIVKGVHYLYFRGVQSSTEWGKTEANWTQMISDYYYRGGLVNMARLWAQNADEKTYLYSLEVPTSLSFGKLRQAIGNDLGVTHMDDIFYYFNTTYSLQEPANERNVINDLKKKLINLLCEMADQGHPTSNELFNTNPVGSSYTGSGSVKQHEYARITLDKTNPNNPTVKVLATSMDHINSKMDFWTYFVPDVLNNTDTYRHPNTVHASYASATWGLVAMVIILVIMCISLVAVIVVTRRNARFMKVPTKSTENIEIKAGRV